MRPEILLLRGVPVREQAPLEAAPSSGPCHAHIKDIEARRATLASAIQNIDAAEATRKCTNLGLREELCFGSYEAKWTLWQDDLRKRPSRSGWQTGCLTAAS
jgi:hypothetical protein